MNALIHDLLMLAKAEDSHAGIVKTQFDLRKMALNTVLEFESRAFEENKKYDYDVQENIVYAGDEKQMKQLLSILIDNAIRYSNQQGQIKVNLKGEAGKLRLSVYNTGGYGLGLSIAKAITEAHKGKITVLGKYGEWVEFIVSF